MKATKKLLLVTALTSVMAVSGANTLASDAGTIFLLGSGTQVTYDNSSGNYPVITAILSQPGTVNGKSYSTWSFLAQDSTGSLDIFSSLSGANYTPTVGDAISVMGTHAPYHQIPEITNVIGGNITISLESSGNTVSAPGISTIPTLNQTTLPENVAGYLWTLDNVTISGISGTFGTGNLTGTITDGSGNSMTLYYWPTSYSVANANLDGTPIPTGPVDITGFVSVYTSGSTSMAEFSPISIVSVPEPVSLALFGVSGLLSLILALRRCKA